MVHDASKEQRTAKPPAPHLHCVSWQASGETIKRSHFATVLVMSADVHAVCLKTGMLYAQHIADVHCETYTAQDCGTQQEGLYYACCPDVGFLR